MPDPEKISVREIQLPTFYRMREIEAQPITRAEGEEEAPARTRIAISSEEPVERFGWFGERWTEVLSHDEGAIDLRRFEAGGISFLRDHDRRQLDGIVREPEVGADRVLRGELQWSEKADSQGVRGDVESNVRPYTSVGYIVKEAEKVAERDGVEEWRITRWEIVEVSSVTIPADVSVGFDRSQMMGRQGDPADLHSCKIIDRTIQDAPRVREEEKMPDKITPGQGNEAAAPASPDSSPGVSVVSGPDERAARDVEVAEIARMADANGMSGKVADWVSRGLTPDQVSRAIVEARMSASGKPPAAEAIPDLPERDRKAYSYRKAILQAADGRLDGLEREVHQECERRLPAEAERHDGLLIPLALDPNALATRTLTSLDAGAGAETVFDQPGELIDLLRAETFVIAAGARVFTGLTAPVPFPKKTSAPTVHWVGENPGSDVAESDIGTGLVTLMPKTMQGALSYSRQLLAIGNLDSEMMVRDELAIGHGQALDRAALHGSGAAGQPIGLYSAADVQIEAMGGVPTYGKLVDMTGKVANQNAHRGALSFMLTPLMAAKMKQTPEHATATMAGWIFQGDYSNGSMCGYPARATNQVLSTLGAGSNEHGILYGNWRDLYLGLWGVMELVVDPFTKKKQGLIEVASFQLGDAQAARGQSFCKATGATLS